MWSETTREQYRRDGLRYASDMTDAERAMVEPFMPAIKRLGRPRKVDLRGVVEGVLYILRTACPWRLLPHDFPHRSTVQRSFYVPQQLGGPISAEANKSACLPLSIRSSSNPEGPKSATTIVPVASR
jgi:hypothetical protein